MATDRDDALRRAERLLAQGQLDAAIGQYVRVVEAHPTDWTALNALGDLYVRAGASDLALPLYTRIADTYLAEGFFPKAAGFYKKILKFAPGDEHALISLAKACAAQGLRADARTYLQTVAAGRRRRGDQTGAAAVLVQLAALDPKDVGARLTAARALATLQPAAAVDQLRTLAEDLERDHRADEALAAWREVLTLDARHCTARLRVAQAALARGESRDAAALLEQIAVEAEPSQLEPIAEVQLRIGRLDDARETLLAWLRVDAAAPQRVVDMAERIAPLGPALSFVCVEAFVHTRLAHDDHAGAAEALQAFLRRHPGHVPALMTLLQVTVEGELDAKRTEVQFALAEAHLDAGQPGRARALAEDLCARQPGDPRFDACLRRSLEQLGEIVVSAEPSLAESVRHETRTVEPLARSASGQGPAADPADVSSAVAGAGAVSDDARDRATEPAVPPPGGPPPTQLRPSRRVEIEVDLTARLDGLGAPSDASERGEPLALEVLPGDAGPERPFGPGHAASGGGLAPGRQTIESALGNLRTQDVPGADLTAIGRTYVGAGLLDEAIEAFVTAAHDPAQRYEAALALVEIYDGRRDVASVLDWLGRAAESAPTPAKRGAALYRLGTLFEQTGESARALAVLLELKAMAPAFRDVSARVARLTAVQSGGGSSTP